MRLGSRMARQSPRLRAEVVPTPSDGGLWRHPAFVVYVSARTISVGGTAVTTVVLPVLVYQLTKSAALTALIGALEAIPYVILGIFAGVIADRVSRRKIMVTCDTSSAVLMASIPLTAAFHLLVVTQLLLVALGVATLFVMFDAANFGALPAVVGRDQLPVAGSYLWSASSVASLAAPAIGGALLGILSPPDVLIIDAASYAASASLIAVVRGSFGPERSNPSSEPGAERLLKSYRADILVGFRFLWREPILRAMTLCVLVAAIGSGGAMSLLVVYVNRALKISLTNPVIGLFFSAGTLGALGAGLVSPLLARRFRIGGIVTLGLLITTVALGAIALSPRIFSVIPCLVVFELSYTVVTITGITNRQMLTPDALQGRVNSTGRLVAWGGQPIGALLGGLLASLLPIRQTFLVMCVAPATAAAVAWVSPLRRARIGEHGTSDDGNPPGE